MDKSNSSSKNQLLDDINRGYTKAILLKLYSRWFHGLLKEYPGIFGKFGLSLPQGKKIPPKTFLIALLYTVFVEKELFIALWEKFPPHLRAVFLLLVWRKRMISEDQLKEKFNIDLQDNIKAFNPEDCIKGEFLIFGFHKFHRYDYRDRKRYNFTLHLSELIRKAVKPHMDPPYEYHLHPVDMQPGDLKVYENQSTVLQELPLYMAYIEQGHLKLSKTGKPLKISLTELKKYHMTNEFYEVSGFQFLRTELMLGLITSKKFPATGEPTDLLKMVMNSYRTEPLYSSLINLLPHLKGRTSINVSYYEVDMKATVWQSFLKVLPVNQWIEFSNISQYARARDISLQCVPFYIANRYLYYTIQRDKDGWRWDTKVYIDPSIYDEAIEIPLLAGSFFLFAAFGLVDIAYEKPVNRHLHQKGKEYLSPFDGLRYVRLTDLGAFLTGKVKMYTPPETGREKAAFILDEKRLLMTMKGEDKLKTLIIEKIARPLPGNRFKMDYESFLKECSNKKEVQEKIDLFRAHVEKNPPPLWEEFFVKVLERVNPLSKKSGISLYKLHGDMELLNLLATDEILKKYILKAENYHVAIEDKAYAKIKKRLESFGYLLKS